LSKEKLRFLIATSKVEKWWYLQQSALHVMGDCARYRWKWLVPNTGMGQDVISCS
jgi:hypothetical protein